MAAEIRSHFVGADSTYVLMYNTQKKRFFLRGIIRTAFSLLFASFFFLLFEFLTIVYDLF
jgi:hypothetical protein